MPHSKSCKKRVLTSTRKRSLNRQNKSDMRSSLKQFRALAETDQATEANLKDIYKVLDVQSRKGIMPRNRAARLKSRMAALIAK